LFIGTDARDTSFMEETYDLFGLSNINLLEYTCCLPSTSEEKQKPENLYVLTGTNSCSNNDLSMAIAF
jgi:hypothetical protein